MSDDRGDCEGWTTSTLYTHFGKILAADHELNRVARAAQDRAVQIAMDASKEATLKAETAYDKRFEAANDIKDAMKNQQAAFITRAEMFGYMGAFAAIITALYYFAPRSH